MQFILPLSLPGDTYLGIRYACKSLEMASSLYMAFTNFFTFLWYSCTISPLVFLYEGLCSISSRSSFEYRSLSIKANELAFAPRLFTKIIKPVFRHLRSLGYLSVIYIDDSYLQGQKYEECCNNVQSISNLISELGFYINEDKSEFRPSKQLVFLGFVLDSVTMRVYLTVVIQLPESSCNRQNSVTCG